MSENSLPSNVHVLKPRTPSLSDRLDAFLTKHSLSPQETPSRCDPTRPKWPGINAIECASCGQAEYLTRDFCRCGHYLHGQLEDEFLSWVGDVKERQNHLFTVAMSKVEKVRLLFPLSSPLIVLPLLNFAFGGVEQIFYSMVCLTFGVLLIAVAALLEVVILSPVRQSQIAMFQSTFQTFLEERETKLLNRVSLGQAQQGEKEPLHE